MSAVTVVANELWSGMEKICQHVEDLDMLEEVTRSLKKVVVKLSELSKNGYHLDEAEQARCRQYITELESLQQKPEWRAAHTNVRFGNNMCINVPCLVFLLESKLRTFLNDEMWYDEEAEYKADYDTMFEHTPYNDRLKFALNDVHYYNTHPRVSFAMSEVKQTLVDLHRTKSMRDFDYFWDVLQLVRDRLCILLTYPYGIDVNDIDVYAVEVPGEELRLPNSRFLWDMYYLYQSTRQQMATYRECMELPMCAADELLKEASPSLRKWFVNMIITAAGDDLNIIFRNYFIRHHLADFELEWFRRVQDKNTKIEHTAPYKIMVSTRGVDDANEMLSIGSSIVKNLLMVEEGCTQHDVVAKRVETMESRHRQILFQCILDYAVNRKWTAFEFDEFVLNPGFTSDTALHYPVMRHVPYTSMVAVAGKFRCENLFDATIMWAYMIMDEYDGIIYNPVSKQGIACTDLLQSMLKYAPEMKTQ